MSGYVCVHVGVPKFNANTRIPDITLINKSISAV